MLTFLYNWQLWGIVNHWKCALQRRILNHFNHALLILVIRVYNDLILVLMYFNHFLLRSWRIPFRRGIRSNVRSAVQLPKIWGFIIKLIFAFNASIHGRLAFLYWLHFINALLIYLIALEWLERSLILCRLFRAIQVCLVILKIILRRSLFRLAWN